MWFHGFFIKKMPNNTFTVYDKDPNVHNDAKMVSERHINLKSAKSTINAKMLVQKNPDHFVHKSLKGAETKRRNKKMEEEVPANNTGNVAGFTGSPPVMARLRRIKKIVSEAFKKDPQGRIGKAKWAHYEPKIHGGSVISNNSYHWTDKTRIIDYFKAHGKPVPCPNCGNELNHRRGFVQKIGQNKPYKSFNYEQGNCPWCSTPLVIFDR